MEEKFISVNKAARKERHKKLFGAGQIAYLKGKFFSKSTKKESEKETQIIDQEYQAKLGRFYWKTSTLVLGIFLFHSIIPTYAFIDETDEITDEFYNQAEEIRLDQLPSTSDGFLFNTSGQSEIGDRSNMMETITYEVQPGDSTSTIANKFHIKTSTITWANDITNVNKLKIGQNLVILPVDGILHKVKKGDTVDKIAKKYSAKADNIISQNQLNENQLIAGKQIIIPGGKMPQIPTYTAYNNRPTRTGGSNAPVSISSVLSASTAAPTNISNLKITKPTVGTYTQYFHRGHYAVDIANSNRGPIMAAHSGKVIKAQGGWNGGYGNVIIIDGGNGLKTLYAHNERLYVKPGDYVSEGQTISWMGNTGRTYGRTGIHLHFELIINGVKKNPIPYFR